MVFDANDANGIGALTVSDRLLLCCNVFLYYAPGEAGRETLSTDWLSVD